MKQIIEIIEQYRKEKRMRKQQLCSYCNLNRNTYTNYIKGAKIPYNVVNAMLACLGKRVLIIDKDSV